MLGNLFSQRKTPTPNLEPQQNNVVGSSMDPTRRQDLSVMTHLDARASQVLSRAQAESARIKQALIEPMQLLLALLYDQEIFKVFEQFSVSPSALSAEIAQKEKEGSFLGQPTLAGEAKRIFEKAYTAAKERGVDFITPEDLLISLLSVSGDAASFLEKQGITKASISEKLTKSEGYTSGKKSALEEFGIDLTEVASKGKLDPIAGRDTEIERLVHILLRRTKNNPIIIGEAGVGKTAIVEGLAQAIVKGVAPKDLTGKRIVQIDVSSLVAGASHRGEFEERLQRVIKETMAKSGQVILFIDEIHTLIGTGDSEGALDASNIIKPFLARGQMQLIGTTTTAEYRKHFEKDKAFSRRFQPIVAAEPDEETAIKMLSIIKQKYETFHKVVITDDALQASVHLSKKYIGERYLPDKAIDLLDEAAAQVRLENSEGKKDNNQVSKADIEKIVSSWTGIPITRLTEDESQKLLELENLMHKRLINQESAVSSVAEAVRRGRIGLASANRPIASFVFLGPTGVGKTELAKTLAEILFGRDDAMIRLDMSEYMEKHEVAKLIGAPPGYVGYEEGGQLTEAVRIKPYSIVLFDEVEKAHPDVFNILLQILEDGRLTDNKGNTISFKNTIIIATSNIGSVLIQQQLQSSAQNPNQVDSKEKKLEELHTILFGELHKFFKPELLNRFDELVVFEPLTESNMLAVAKLGISNTNKMLKEQNITIQISETALSQLAKEGYDPVYGARPLRRLIQSSIENPIALLIIKKQFVASDTILVDYTNTGEFSFTKGQAAQPPAPQPDTTSPDQPAPYS